MTANIATSIAIVKTKYSPDYVKFVVYEENPSFASVKHDETWDGGVLQVAVQTEAPIGGGFSIAQDAQHVVERRETRRCGLEQVVHLFGRHGVFLFRYNGACRPTRRSSCVWMPISGCGYRVEPPDERHADNSRLPFD